MKNKKIFICGPSGTGKTTLAKWISATYRIPFISTSGKALWGDFDIHSHAELINLCNKDKAFAEEYQWHLLRYRNKALRNVDEFVTDRSPIDNLVYFLLQVSPNITKESTISYIKACEEAIAYGNKIIYLPFINEIDIENDGYRITNPYYQNCISSIFDYVIEGNLLNINNYYTIDDIMAINQFDWDIRMKLVYKFLKPKNNIIGILKNIWQRKD